MQNENQLYKKIIEQFCEESLFCQGLRIETPEGFLKTSKRDFEFISLNTAGVLMFVKVPSPEVYCNIGIDLRSALNCLASKLSISPRNAIVCGVSATNYFFFNVFNERVDVFNASEEGEMALFERISAEINSRQHVFSHNDLKELADKLMFTSGHKLATGREDKVKTDASGKVLIKKHGSWREASDVNAEQLFITAALGGMFGLHLFYLKKHAKGILYLLTLGLFGVGWFFDCIEMLFGVYKDPSGRYLLPVQNKLRKCGMMLLGGGIFAAAWFLVSSLPGLISSVT